MSSNRGMHSRKPRLIGIIYNIIKNLNEKDGSTIHRISAELHKKMVKAGVNPRAYNVFIEVRRALKFGLNHYDLIRKSGRYKVSKYAIRRPVPKDSYEMFYLKQKGRNWDKKSKRNKKSEHRRRRKKRVKMSDEYTIINDHCPIHGKYGRFLYSSGDENKNSTKASSDDSKFPINKKRPNLITPIILPDPPNLSNSDSDLGESSSNLGPNYQNKKLEDRVARTQKPCNYPRKVPEHSRKHYHHRKPDKYINRTCAKTLKGLKHNTKVKTTTTKSKKPPINRKKIKQVRKPTKCQIHKYNLRPRAKKVTTNKKQIKKIISRKGTPRPSPVPEPKTINNETSKTTIENQGNENITTPNVALRVQPLPENNDQPNENAENDGIIEIMPYIN